MDNSWRMVVSYWRSVYQAINGYWLLTKHLNDVKTVDLSQSIILC